MLMYYFIACIFCIKDIIYEKMQEIETFKIKLFCSPQDMIFRDTYFT